MSRENFVTERRKNFTFYFLDLINHELKLELELKI